jgi:hypothetical protein
MRVGARGAVLASVALACSILVSRSVEAQEHAGHDMSAAAPSWIFMQDGVAWLMVNAQGSPRGKTELKAPNWWMGMAQRRVKRGTLTFTTMLSLDPATVGDQGYSHVFQSGETYQGNALIDHQHPHDFLMQAAAMWRQPMARGATLTLVGAPVGEPALGPVAFMHRSSAMENPMSPLGHHTFDSTHIAMGVLTGAIEKGPVQVESSIFHGAEPDENRWDLMDPGSLDSWSVRGWYRPSRAWSIQASYGFLTHPEVLEEGDVRRTTVSASWNTPRDDGSTAVTLAWGRNKKLGGTYDAFLGELTRQYAWHGTISWRAEVVQVEDDLLRTGVHIFQGGRKKAHVVIPGKQSFVGAFTLGATKTVWRARGWDAAAGTQLTGYAVPGNLAPFYGNLPWSVQVFFRVRPPAMHRMLDTTMTRPPM